MDHAYIDEHRVAEAYLAGTLPDDEVAVFVAHCSKCEECADRLELARLFFKHKAPHVESSSPTIEVPQPEAVHSVNGSGQATGVDFMDVEPDWIRVTVETPDLFAPSPSQGEDQTMEAEAGPGLFEAEQIEPEPVVSEQIVLEQIGVEEIFAEHFDERITVEQPTMELVRVSSFKPWVIPTIASLATTLAIMMEVIRRQQIELARRKESEEPLPSSARFVMQFEPWQLVTLGAIAALLLLLMPATYFLWELTQLIGR